MTDYQRQEYIENAMTQIELVKKVSGEAGYPTLKKNFEKQKVELLKSIDSASNSASVKLFEMFPILNNSWVLAGLLVFTLLTTFSLVNGILIRTLCVYGLSSMIQKDETILNPEEPKEIVYSERRPPQ